MKTFTTYAEKKAKQFLNLLQGYTKGIRITAILILLLMGVNNAWAGNNFTSGVVVYFDNTITKWSTIYLRVGHSSWNSAYQLSKVNGTDALYTYTIPSWSGYDAFSFANKSGRTDGYTIYQPSNYKYTSNFPSGQTTYFSGWNLDKMRLFIPTGVNNTADGCTYYNTDVEYNNYQRTVTIKSPTNGSITITYKNESNTSQTKTSGSFKVAQTCIITVTATPNAGYELSSLKVGGNSFTSGNTYVVRGDIEISATFSAKTYTVTLDNQGATTAGAASVTATYNAAMPSIANNLPKKTGYTFNGYYTATSGGTQYYKADGTSAKNWDKTSATILYAQWTINSHTVTWKANGGNWSGNTADKVVTYNYGATIAEQAAPTRVGYEFAGWSPAFVANTTMPDNDLTYTAKWTANTYDVTLNPQSGSGGTTSVTATYGSAMPAITKPTRTGYTFNGYYDATSGGTQYYKADGSSAKNWDKTSNTTLYAQWTLNQYTLTYGVYEGSLHGSISLDGGNAVTTYTSTSANYNTKLTLTAAPADGYKIAGWYSDASCATKINEAGTNERYSLTLTDNMTVYVKFAEADEEMSNVTVNATEGGTVNTIGTVPVGNKTPSTFTATPAPGYRFDEWTYTGGIRTSGSLTNSSIDITANGTGTLTAHFTRVHTVNFYATPAIAGSVAATVGGNTITSGDKLDTGRRITFTASVANTYNGQCTFVKWVDGAGTLLSTETTYEHNLTGDITVKGIFKITQYTLTFSASEGGHVSAKANNSAIASPANLDYNTSVTLTAEPDAGCAFDGWYESSTKKSSNTSYTITLTAAKTLEARFTKGTTVYMKAIEYWKKDHPRYAIYYWKGEENHWADMTNVDCNGDIYEGYVPAGYTNFKFVRLAPSTSNEWENKWNETPDLTTTNHAGEMYIQPHVYLKPNSNWTQSSARFAAYFYADGKEAKWFSMNDLDGDGIYSCEIPTGYTSVIFCRMNPNFDTNDWNRDDNDYVWNQTNDLTIPIDGKNQYAVAAGAWSNGSGTWSFDPHKNGWQTYAEPSYKITYSNPANGTITVTQAGNNVANGTSLNMGDEIQITFTPADSYELINYNVDYATETGEEGVYSVCGPTNITAEFAKTGTARTVYLRPNEDWLRDEPIFAAYAWNSKNNTQNHWYIMTTKADDYTGAYSCNISSTYDWVTFVRIKPKGRDNSDGTLDFQNAWNQTIDLQIMNNTPRFAIGEERTVDDKQKYDGAWEENTPIWGLATNFNDWKAEKAVFKGYPGKLDVTPPFGTSHEFKLYNFFGTEASNNLWHGNSGTMKRANSGQWWTMEGTEGANCKMMQDVKGEYIYQMRFLTIGTDLKKQVSVTYPAADMYYVMYEETTSEGTKQRISYGIGITGEERLDTVSFFVDIAKSAKIYILNGNREKVGDYYTIIGTGGENPGGAMAPKRRAAAEEDPTLRVEQGCGIEESGVYNFVAQQDAAGNVSLLTIDKKLHWHAYTGAYYIRTDAASGGWGGYKQSGNKMTYTSYADKNHNFDHYYCKWITSSSPSYSNVKFCVANDYSHQLSDELDGDEIIEKTGVHTGCLPANANVRFGWDSKTNELSRAYISGSATAADRFLVLTGNEYLLDINGQTFNVTGLYKNEAIFGDQGNWVYQLDVQANTQTAIKLTAKFNDRVQTFFGDARAAADGEEVMAATTPEYHKVRMIYNFKTNHLLAAWLLDHPNQDINNGEVNANVLIIRENHGDANQLQFKQGLNQMAVNTAYATMTFTNTHVNDNSLSQWLRYEYWVSFPFDVKISDVFGFGEYGDQWIMQLYDGAERAEKGNWKDSPSFWKYITNRNYTLQAGVGYVLKLQASKMTVETAFQYSDKVSLYFPSTPNDAGNTIISATPDTQHEIDEHECTIERDDRYIYDSHWNLIGVPGYANITEFNTAASKSPVEYKNEEVSFYYEYNAADNTYQANSATSNFKNMHSYMVQFAGTINWSTKEAIKPTELAARHNSDYAEPEKVSFRLELTQGEEKADQTFVQLQEENATPEFDMNLDLTKIINSGANIYTLAGDARIQTAGNVLPMGECIVPVGVKIDAASEYTFRMPDGTEGMVVELIDYEENTKTNLLLSEYTTTLPKGTHESRFALSVKPDKVATSIENAGDEVIGDEVKKYIINGKLFLQKDGILYNAQGHIVR